MDRCRWSPDRQQNTGKHRDQKSLQGLSASHRMAHTGKHYWLGQARGNSGVFLASTGTGDGGYELQVLDPYNNKTYVNGQAGSIYKQSIPLANPGRKPGEWQAYDVVWTAPTFNADGSLKTPLMSPYFSTASSCKITSNSSARLCTTVSPTTRATPALRSSFKRTAIRANP